MDTHHQQDDLRIAPQLLQLVPQEAKAFLAFKSVAERADGIIPQKYRELISIAVALTTQCSYCIDTHTKNASKAGASREEIAETVFIAAALRAGAVAGHGLMALRLFDQHSSHLKEPAG